MVPRKISGARRCKLPLSIPLQLATLRPSPPAGPQWFHEIMVDGYRLLRRIDCGKVTLTTRQNHDWTKRLPDVAAELPTIPVKAAWSEDEVEETSPSDVVSNI